jgi:hypothetical protein
MACRIALFQDNARTCLFLFRLIIKVRQVYFKLMKSIKDEPYNTSWIYKLWVIIQIPPLFIYYTILRPTAFYFKDLIAEQNGSIRYKNSQRAHSQSGDFKKVFISQTVIILSKTFIRYLIKYWWVVAIIFIIWLILDISLLPAIESVGGWIFLWVIYKAVKSLIKGINQ